MPRPIGSYRDLCYLIYPHWLGIMITHSRETYQPTNIYIYIHSMMRWDGAALKKKLWMLKTAQNCSSGLWPPWISRVVTRSHESGCNPILAALSKYPILGICETHHFQVFGDYILNSCMMLGHLPTPVQPQPLHFGLHQQALPASSPTHLEPRRLSHSLVRSTIKYMVYLGLHANII
jgi:hypothetical protein